MLSEELDSYPSRQNGGSLRPVTDAPSELRAAAEQVRAAVRVALAHAGAWRLFADDLPEENDERPQA
jgi:hypothetical protein